MLKFLFALALLMGFSGTDFNSLANAQCGIQKRGSCFKLPGSRGWYCPPAADGCYIYSGVRGCSIVCPGQNQL
ncbi:MAG: hypothetical protein ACXWQJ_03860 [Bdellovibrionota bacterium]